MRATLCFGGSIFAPEWPDFHSIQEIAKTIRKLKSQKHELLVVVGGGGPSREYIKVAQKLGISGVDQDHIGIAVTRLNAQLLALALGNLAEPTPVTAFEKAFRAMMKYKVPVMGGTTPGQTTDAVAAMLAQVSKSELLIFFSDVDGIYTADPKLNPDAKKIDKMTAEELVKILGSEEMKPGIKTIMDPVAVKLIRRSNIETLVLGKHEIKRLPDILNGAKHTGTTIVRVSE